MQKATEKKKKPEKRNSDAGTLTPHMERKPTRKINKLYSNNNVIMIITTIIVIITLETPLTCLTLKIKGTHHTSQTHMQA